MQSNDELTQQLDKLLHENATLRIHMHRRASTASVGAHEYQSPPLSDEQEVGMENSELVAASISCLQEELRGGGLDAVFVAESLGLPRRGKVAAGSAEEDQGERIEQLEQQLAEAEEERGLCKAELEASRARSDELMSSEELAFSLHRERDTLLQSAVQRDETITSLKQQLAVATAGNTRQSSRAEVVTAQLVQTQGALTDAQRDVDLLTQRLRSAEAATAKAQKAQQETARREAQQAKELQALRDSLAIAETTQRESELRLEGALAKADRLNGKLAAAETKLEAVQSSTEGSELSSSRRERESTEGMNRAIKQAARLRDQLHEAKHALTSLTRQRDAATAQNASLTEECNSLRRELQNVRRISSDSGAVQRQLRTKVRVGCMVVCWHRRLTIWLAG